MFQSCCISSACFIRYTLLNLVWDIFSLIPACVSGFLQPSQGKKRWIISPTGLSNQNFPNGNLLIKGACSIYYISHQPPPPTPPPWQLDWSCVDNRGTLFGWWAHSDIILVTTGHHKASLAKHNTVALRLCVSPQEQEIHAEVKRQGSKRKWWLKRKYSVIAGHGQQSQLFYTRKKLASAQKRNCFNHTMICLK